MRSNLKIWGSIGLLTAALFAYTNATDTKPSLNHPAGLKPIDAEEAKKIGKNRIQRIRPNQLAIDRANEARLKKGLNPLPKVDSQTEDIETVDVSGAAAGTNTETTIDGTVAAAIAQVDNSQLSAFPPISSQGSLPSCVAWAATYYQMSHQFCLATGCDNKTLRQAVFSPKWTYNMINSGQAQGTYFSDAFAMQQRHGASLWSEFPYDSDYRSWNLNPSHWALALQRKMSATSSLSVNTDSGINSLKQLLNNGHVLVIGTYIYSWNFRTVQANPNLSANPYVGQSIVAFQNGTSGGHAMTVVGYDDGVWTDINGNGTAEAGEIGAFKIANSWGSGWGNAGFVWASYDAFRNTTAVPGFAPSGRNQLTQGGGAYLHTYTPYQPRLLAQVTVAHGARSEMSLRFATSSTSSRTPSSYENTFALNFKGGPFGFDGGTAVREGTFYFDISSLLTSSVDNQLFYLLYSDNAASNPLYVQSFQVIDPTTLNPLVAAASAPLTVDAVSGQLIAGNYTPDLIAPTAPTNLAAKVTTTVAKGKKGTAKTTVALSWGASSDNVGISRYIVYRNGVKLTELGATSLSYSDTSTAAGNSYTYQVSARDAEGNESAKSNLVTVNR